MRGYPVDLSEAARVFAPWLLGAAGFAASFLLFLPFNILAGAGIAAAVYLGSLVALDPDRKADPAQGFQNPDHRTMIRDAQSKIERIQALALAQGTSRHFRQGVKAIADMAAQVLLRLRKDPSRIMDARRFLAYYLDATLSVLEKYQAFASRDRGSDEVHQLLNRVESNLSTIRDAFRRQYQQLDSHDILDLDTELKVLERTMQSEQTMQGGTV